MSGMIQYLRELHFTSVVVRLALAMLLGGSIGLERGRKRRFFFLQKNYKTPK